MALFADEEASAAYAKVGFMGQAGSGKTHTASLFAIGLVQHLRASGVAGADKPVFMLDTEKSAAWVRPMFAEAGIKLLVEDKTRAFKDLVPALRMAEDKASILIIDSITHFWAELQASYMAKKNRNRLEFQDWAVIKGMWRQFTDLYVNGSLHCILCGRLGYEYEDYKDDDGRRQIEKTGVKMKAEGELGYEPSMLVWMEREMDLDSKVTYRTATILKDRSRTLDGKELRNPTFASFMPHVAFLNLGGQYKSIDTERSSVDTIPDDPRRDNKSVRRKIVLDEIEALLVEHYPTTKAEDKQAKAALIKKHFKTVSWTEISELMPLHDLQACFDGLHVELTGKASHYDQTRSIVNDEIPNFDAPVEPAAKAPEALEQTLQPETEVAPSDPVADVPADDPNDTEIVARDIEAVLRKAGNLTRLAEVWRLSERELKSLDDLRQARVRMTYTVCKARFGKKQQATANV